MRRSAFLLALLLLLTGCGAGDTAVDHTAIESYAVLAEPLEDAVFYVRAIAGASQALSELSDTYVFSFTPEEDFAGDLELTEDGGFRVYADEGAYDPGTTYYLLLTASTTPTLSSVGVTMYQAVAGAPYLSVQEDGSVWMVETPSAEQVAAVDHTVVLADPEDATLPDDADTLDSLLRSYTAAHADEIAARKAEALPDLSAGSLEAAMEQADVIVQITVKSLEEATLYLSQCRYSLDATLKGDAGDMTSSLRMPTQLLEEGRQYLLLLCERLDEDGAFVSYSVGFDDCWLLPLDSAEAQTVLAAYPAP